jgi:hypothetical protein
MLKITFGFLMLVLFSFLVNSVQLKTQWDMNHQDYVANYFLFQAVLFFVTRLFGFWVNQT